MKDPLDFLVSYFNEEEKLFDQIAIELSYYEYMPQTILDKRKIIPLDCILLDRGDFEDILENCPLGHEVAIHSKYQTKKNDRRKNFHVPMIDFCCEVSEIREVVEKARKTLPEKIWKTLHFYSSGRSIHAYALSPIKESEFTDFMGRCLLMNLPGERPLVDSRWVGHRIMAGYGSLRISHNTSNYLSAPKFMGTVIDFM